MSPLKVILNVVPLLRLLKMSFEHTDYDITSLMIVPLESSTQFLLFSSTSVIKGYIFFCF